MPKLSVKSSSTLLTQRYACSHLASSYPKVEHELMYHCADVLLKKEEFKGIVPIRPPPQPSSSRSLADEVKQMPAEYRRREGRSRKCVFCHIFFFSHAVKCRRSEARFNHRSVEQCSSLRQDPEAPLAVQICSEEESERDKKAKHAALNHTLCAFPPGHVLFSLPVFPV